MQPANQIRAGFLKIFSALDAGLSAADAEKVKTVLLGIFDDVGRMAEFEMEAGILDDSLSGPRAPQLSYNAARETRLNADEQKTFAGFMKNHASQEPISLHWINFIRGHTTDSASAVKTK